MTAVSGTRPLTNRSQPIRHQRRIELGLAPNSSAKSVCEYPSVTRSEIPICLTFALTDADVRPSFRAIDAGE